MGEANFYYFTCLKLHLVFSGLQLFEREMANSLAIVLVLATIAHLGSSRMMTGDWASKVCAAYYKASELGTFPPVYPGGFGWNDKVCLADPSFYLECKFVNGVFVGEKRQCPPGKLFYHGANPMWEKTCVPADRYKTNKCPDWLGMIPPSPGPKCVHAVAEILPNNALPREDKKVSGVILIRQRKSSFGFKSETEFKIHIQGLPRNSFHGFHIHEFGTIGASCTQSGGHYNPHAKNHGAREAESKHVGDLGNLKSDNNGIVKKTFKDTRATLHSLATIVGRAFVLHAGIDDLGLKSDQGSKTTGNAGGRVACGTIVWSNGEGWRRPQPLPQLHVTAVLTECQRQRESALKLGNYAPSCDLNGNFKPLQCGAGFCWCVYADGTKIPNTKCDMALSALTDAKCLLHRKDSTPVVFKPLQCRAGFCWCAYADGTKILNTKVIAAFSTLTDAKCAFYRITPPSPIDSFKPLQCGAGFCWCVFVDGTKIPNTKVAMALSTLTDAKCMILRMKVPTPTEEVIIPVGMTKRQCACKMALKLSTSGSSSAYACDPHLQQNYLICQDDGTFESKSCPAGEAWNYMEKTCSDKMRKCRPIPATCAAL